MAYRFTSPMLDEKQALLKECPIGVIIRESPYIYDAINVHVYAENGALNPLKQSSWLQHAFNVIGSEKARLFKLKNSGKRGKSDSEYGRRMRGGK